MNDKTRALIKTIHRHDAQSADFLGLIFSEDDLQCVYDAIGRLWILEKITEDKMPNIEDIIKDINQ